MTKIKIALLQAQVVFITGILLSGQAHAAGNNFGDIARNINDSIEEIPGLLTSLSYLMGMLLGVLGVMKLKDHVENPSQTPMKDGAIRLASGGALFALPILFESMYNTIGETSTFVSAAALNKAEFNIR